MNEIRLGRTLQLEGLELAKNKVVIGFASNAGTKIQLAQEASKYGMSLSEYVDTIILNRNNPQTASANEVIKEVIKPDLEAQKRIEAMNTQIKLLQTKVGFYENDALKSAYETNKGKLINVNDKNGKPISISINRIEDVYDVLLFTTKLK